MLISVQNASSLYSETRQHSYLDSTVTLYSTDTSCHPNRWGGANVSKFLTFDYIPPTLALDGVSKIYSVELLNLTLSVKFVTKQFLYGNTVNITIDCYAEFYTLFDYVSIGQTHTLLLPHNSLVMNFTVEQLHEYEGPKFEFRLIAWIKYNVGLSGSQLFTYKLTNFATIFCILVVPPLAISLTFGKRKLFPYISMFMGLLLMNFYNLGYMLILLITDIILIATQNTEEDS